LDREELLTLIEVLGYKGTGEVLFPKDQVFCYMPDPTIFDDYEELIAELDSR
jgi:hypothetical protein